MQDITIRKRKWEDIWLDKGLIRQLAQQGLNGGKVRVISCDG